MSHGRARPRHQAFADPANLPKDMIIENVPRRRFTATVENLVLTFDLKPGLDFRNAVIMAWKDPIRRHEEQVLEVERCMDAAQESMRKYAKIQGTAKNWETAWLMMSTSYDYDLDEYLELKAEMANLHEKLLFITNVEARAELEDKWKKFKQWEPPCERLLAAQKVLEGVRKERDAAFADTRGVTSALEEAKKKERELAEQISDDHVEADAQGVAIADLFPTVYIGFIISRVNGFDTEDLLFHEILSIIDQADTPHRVEVRRYDYRYNEFTGVWESLQEMRLKGRYVEDPRAKRQLFIDWARRGNVQEVELALTRGEDPDATDATECTGLHHAACNGHFRMMKLLLQHNATIDHRDMNMETALLHACRRGDLHVVEFLLDKGANIDTRDRNLRTPLFHAIMAKNVPLVEFLLQKRTSLTITDKVWKWTPLHFAASFGSVEIVDLLLARRASPYALSEHGWDPEQAARENSCLRVADLLKQYVFNEPAQKVIMPLATDPDPRSAGGIWIGSHEAAEPRWAIDRGFRAIVSLYRPSKRDPKHLWIQNEDRDEIWWLPFEVNIADSDRKSASWSRLLIILPKILHFLDRAMADRREILIHDTTGVSTSFAVACIYLLVKRRVRLDPAMEHVQAIRKQCKLAPAMHTGLKNFQEELDERKIQRMNDRIRHSPVISLGF